MKICPMCNKRPCEKDRKSFRKFCYRCRRPELRGNWQRRLLRKIVVKEKCEVCGFVPEIKEQLDIHHIDGNHKNNDRKNLIVLCANCHRLETHNQNAKI